MADMYGCVIVKTSASLSGKTVSFTDETGTKVTSTIDSKGICKKFLPAFHHYTITVMGDSNLGTSAECDMSCGYTYTYELTLNTGTWAGIKNIVNLGLASQFISNGDKLDVKLTDGTTLTYEAQVNTYGLKEVDFIPTTLYGTHNMNPSNTNAGGYIGSAMKSYLDDTFYNLLPSDLKAVISSKTLRRSKGSQLNELQSETTKIFLPTEYEVFGAKTYSAAVECDGVVQKHYPTFNSAANRIRKNAGAAAPWWLSSPIVSDSTSFCLVGADGTPSNNYASTAKGVCPCFRIAPS